MDGPPAVQIYATKNKRKISFGALTDRLLDADLICIGETHDSDLCHRVQLEIIKGLYARDERLGVGMEMFQRPFQKDLDQYLRGETNEEAFLKASDYRQRWGFDWSLYRPIVEFCRRNSVPLAALNAPRELTRKISKSGYAALTDDERKQLGEVDFQVKAHRDYWYDLLPKMHGQTDATPEQKEHSYQVMTVWDDYMAASAAQFQKDRNVRRMVVLAGSGHIERGFGIPARAAQRTGGKAATITIVAGGDLEKLAKEPTTDYVVVVK
jgi:aminopeptidase N